MPSTQAPADDPSHAAQMPCHSKYRRPKRPKKRLELPSPLTLWEAHVLSLSKRSNKRIIFDMEMDSNDDNKTSKKSNNTDKNDEAADLDAATQQMMSENQIPKATTIPNAPEEQPTATATELAPTTQTTAELPPALLASLESARSLSQNNPNTNTSKPPSNSPSTSTPSSSTPSITHKYFGPHQTAALSPSTLHDDAARQEALIRTRSTGELTLKRRLAAEEEMAAAYREEDLMMSGALEEGDARCEVCQRRETAGEGGVESGVLAL